MDYALLGLLWYLPALVLFIIFGVLYLNKDRKITQTSIKNGLKDAPGNTFFLIIVLFFIKLENKIQDFYPSHKDYTYLIYNLEGNNNIILLQNALKENWEIHFFSIVYLVLFLGMILLIPIFLTLTGDKRNLRTFTYMVIFNYLILIPFYLFFNVTVTSMYPSNTGVKPLLYQHGMYQSLVLLVDRMNDCFPSGHISLMLSVLLLSFLDIPNKRLQYLSTIAFVLITFAVLYLGIHWILDDIGGALLGFFAFTMAKNRRVRGNMDALVDRINKWYYSHLNK